MIKSIWLKFYDKEALLSILTQALALLFPLFFIWYLTEYFGKGMVVSFEVMLSLVGFFAIFLDYGTSIFLSHRSVNQKFLAKIVGTVIILKLVLLFIIGLILISLSLIFEDEHNTYSYAFALLLIACFDMPFVFFSKGKSHYYSMLLVIKLPICLLVTMLAHKPFMGYAVGSFIVVLINMYYVLRLSKFKLKYSKRWVLFLLRRYKLYTLTESMTSIFSQLDGFLVSKILNEEHSFIYLLVRKVVRAANSLMAYVYRIVYTRRKREHSSFSNVTSILLLFNIASFLLLNLFAETVFYAFFGSDVDPEGIITAVVFLQSLILLFGAFKTIMRNSYVFVEEKFILHFVSTCISAVVFLLPIIWYYNTKQSASAIVISGLRLSSDIGYLISIMFYIFIYSRFESKA